jgi:murE/murF fusion protein
MDSTGLTTPDPVLLQRQLRRFVDEGFAEACAIEASSIGIVERRLDGDAPSRSPSSPISRRTTSTTTAAMEAYWEAKAELFRWPGPAAAVINIDDAKGELMTLRQRPGPLDGVLRRAGAPAGTRHRLRRPGLRFEVAEGAERHAATTGRPVQRVQPARRAREPCAPGRAAGDAVPPAPACCPCPAAWRP